MQEQEDKRLYLVIVRREGDTWIVDEDSTHLLDEEEGEILELRVQTILTIG